MSCKTLFKFAIQGLPVDWAVPVGFGPLLSGHPPEGQKIQISQMNLTSEQLELLRQCRELLAGGFDCLPSVQSGEVTSSMVEVLKRTAVRLHDNFPYPHPFYLGQMLRPPHPVSQLAYTLAMTINPNNHAHDGGRASSAMEKEAVAQLAAMFGWKEHLGHLCGGGTMANFEALWVARELTDGKGIAASTQSHYTHERLSRVLKVPFHSVAVDAVGRMDLNCLEAILKEHEVGTVVATLGTTGLGAIDPLDELLKLRDQYRFRLHVDAAYGGYFRIASKLSKSAARAFEAMEHADSIVIDPHKHGLQPYGCGCVLFRDRSVAAIYHHESPYTYFTSDDLHLGEISLECSRAGASAVALWATMQLFPLTHGGEFARDLDRCRQAAKMLQHWIEEQPRLSTVVEPELDLVVWVVRAQTATESSRLARFFFDEAARENIHLALLTLPQSILESSGAITDWDTPEVTCVRACLMKPEHLEWMPRILSHLDTVVARLDHSSD